MNQYHEEKLENQLYNKQGLSKLSMNSVERKSLQSDFAKETTSWQPGQLAASRYWSRCPYRRD